MMKKRSDYRDCKQNRPLFVIEKEIREAVQTAQAYQRRGNIAGQLQQVQRANELRKEYDNAVKDEAFHRDVRDQNKDERGFFGKLLSLHINELDMSFYHIEMFFEYMKDKGYQSVPEWDRRSRNLTRALKEYREFVDFFIENMDNRVANEVYFMELINLVADRVFTDRERVYYDRYEIKAAKQDYC